MTQLTTFNECRFPELLTSRVQALQPVLLYYVFTGRNAWHSTWVQRYTPGCMHTSLQSARQYAEARRVQGTVFNIKELPALLFRSPHGCLVVTQINSHDPLATYAAMAVHDDVGPGQRKIDGALDCYMVPDAPMQGVLLSFEPGSRFWHRAPAPRDSVIRVATDDSKACFAELPERGLLVQSSFSQGSRYQLGWRSREEQIGSKGVRQVLAG